MRNSAIVVNYHPIPCITVLLFALTTVAVTIQRQLAQSHPPTAHPEPVEESTNPG